MLCLKLKFQREEENSIKGEKCSDSLKLKSLVSLWWNKLRKVLIEKAELKFLIVSLSMHEVNRSENVASLCI